MSVSQENSILILIDSKISYFLQDIAIGQAQCIRQDIPRSFDRFPLSLQNAILKKWRFFKKQTKEIGLDALCSAIEEKRKTMGMNLNVQWEVIIREMEAMVGEKK